MYKNIILIIILSLCTLTGCGSDNSLMKRSYDNGYLDYPAKSEMDRREPKFDSPEYHINPIIVSFLECSQCITFSRLFLLFGYLVVYPYISIVSINKMAEQKISEGKPNSSDLKPPKFCKLGLPNFSMSRPCKLGQPKSSKLRP